MSTRVKFIDTYQSSFFAVTRQRVEMYFKQHLISKNANKAMWLKALFFLTTFLLLYTLILSNKFNVWTMALLAGLLGAFSAFIGINICHDAIHGAFSANKRVNQIFSLLLNFIGVSPYLWRITHNIVHHTFPNIPGHDEDIAIAPGLIRLSVTENVNKIQRYQHIYAFFLYGFTSLTWVFRKDYVKFFKKKIGEYPNDRHPKKEYFNLFLYKAVYYFLFIGLPLVLLHITWWQFIIGFLVMHVVEGMILGLVFQFAHMVEGTVFPFPNDQGNIEDAWAEHQMRTTANFARKSPLVCFFYGGLNFQIEHHLFPRICHIHYPALSAIVKQTAEEFNLPYIENTTFFSAMHSHYRMLRKLGKEAYAEKVYVHK